MLSAEGLKVQLVGPVHTLFGLHAHAATDGAPIGLRRHSVPAGQPPPVARLENWTRG